MCDSSTSCPSFKSLLSLEKLTKVNEFWYLLLLQRLLLTTTVCSHSGLQYHMNPAWDLSFFLSKSLCQFALFLSSSYIEAVSWKSWSHPNAWCYYIEFHLPILASAPHSPFLYDSSAFMAHKGELLTQHWRPKSEVFSSDHPNTYFHSIFRRQNIDESYSKYWQLSWTSLIVESPYSKLFGRAHLKNSIISYPECCALILSR